MYGVFHAYTIDDGYGNAVYNEDLVAVTDSEETADRYCTIWSVEDEYCPPCDGDTLRDGELYYKELNTINALNGDMLKSPYELFGINIEPRWKTHPDDSRENDLWRIRRAERKEKV